VSTATRRYGTTTRDRECLNCDELFTPAASGWQALYCSLPCWRANNGGPTRAQRPEPVTAVDPFMPRAEVERREAFVQEVAAALDRPRLVVVARERCPRCGVDHDVYALAEKAGADG
jgi:hypothetical protein